jgi:hypothetical protein
MIKKTIFINTLVNAIRNSGLLGNRDPRDLFNDYSTNTACIDPPLVEDEILNNMSLDNITDPDDSTQTETILKEASKPLKQDNQNILTWLLNEDPKNPYFTFLNDVSVKEYPPGTRTHIHHIIPKHLFKRSTAKNFLNSSFNLIVLSLEDHKKAHQILFDLYGDQKDYGAILLLQGSMSDAVQVWRQAGARATNELMRSQQRTVFNQEFQIEMGRRSLRRSDALEIRSRGGRLGGRNRNIGRVIRPENRYLFYRNGQEFLCIFNCSTGGDVLKELNKAVPTNLQRATQLLNGSRKNLNGWSCIKLNTENNNC